VRRSDNFKSRDVADAVDLILDRFVDTYAYVYPYRFGLALCQRVCFGSIDLIAPSIDIGINDGLTAAIVHYGKPPFSWGADMPEESTFESRGLYIEPEFNVYERFVGLDVSSNVPFGDETFNTVCATEVFSYGIDRDRTLKELARVLAPGGTVAFSENSEAILGFDGAREGLMEVVPTLDVLEDSRTYYRETLKKLGLVDITYRQFFKRELAGLLQGLMYAGDPHSDHSRHQRLLVEDQRLRRFYTDALLAIAAGIDDEFSSDSETEGWHVFVTARKPGTLDPSLPVPEPRCPTCGSSRLATSMTSTACDSCGRTYLTRYGNPYLLVDDTATFSPKRERPAHLAETEPLDLRIDAVLSASYADPPPRVALYGVDPTTAFTVRHLQQAEVEVVAATAATDRWNGHLIEGVPIVDLDDIPHDVPIIVSAFPGTEDVLNESATRFSGRTVYSIAQGDKDTGLKAVGLSDDRVTPPETADPSVGDRAAPRIRALIRRWRS
jgi:SAM-dependent methyltransferase